MENIKTKHYIVARLLFFSGCAYKNISRSHLSKLNLGCPAKMWWLVACGRDVAADTTLVERIICVNLVVVLLLCGIDNT